MYLAEQVNTLLVIFMYSLQFMAGKKIDMKRNVKCSNVQTEKVIFNI